MTTPDFAQDRQTIKALAGKVRQEIQSQGQASAESLANCRAAIKALKAKVDDLLPQGSRNRNEADNFLKALIGLSKMLETPSVSQFLTGLDKVNSTTLGHLIAFMHTFNLRFGAAKTPVQEQTYDQLYPLLVAVRDQDKVPSANPYTTSSGPQDPKKLSAYFSGMQFDSKNGVVPPPRPRPASLDERDEAVALTVSRPVQSAPARAVLLTHILLSSEPCPSFPPVAGPVPEG